MADNISFLNIRRVFSLLQIAFIDNILIGYRSFQDELPGLVKVEPGII